MYEQMKRMCVTDATVWLPTSGGFIQSNRFVFSENIFNVAKTHIMDPPNYKTIITASPTSDSDKFKSGEGSLKFKSRRPRSRTGSGGILRVDVNKPAMLSSDLVLVEPPSPQPSVDRLSVTFATEERSICSSDASVKLNLYVPGTPPICCMDKVRFPTITDGEDSEEDYSASVTAIMQRRASTRKSRKKGRRTSSPFSHDQDALSVRRRSSCFTTSSGDTAISIEESLQHEVTQEQIFENIRLHKEVLSSVKMQPWVMKRKLKLVQQAKSYIKRHQGALQERLAQSRSTRDILARWNIYLVQKLHHLRRELANLSNYLIPWEARIKEIESHFGSVVASYFTFLRWLFWVNLITSVVLVAFVAIPELLTADRKSAGERKIILPEDRTKSTNLLTLWDFEGVLKYSPLFYGFYTDKNGTGKGYRLPLAYFMTGLAVYVYSFVATLRKMAENSRMSKLSEKDDECVFSWKLFTGWDYMIGNAETAQNRVASIILGFKEALLEEAEKKREPRNWKIIAARVFVNLMVLALLAVSAYAVVEVVQRSTQTEAAKTFWRRNEITVVMSLISFLFPMFFEGLGYFEHYHPRKQLRLQLARIMVLNMLNLYSLIFALFGKITNMKKELDTFKNSSFYNPTSLTPPSSILENCVEVYENCTNITMPNFTAESLVSSALLVNLTVGLILAHMNKTEEPKNLNDSKDISSSTEEYDYYAMLFDVVESYDLEKYGLNLNETDEEYSTESNNNNSFEKSNPKYNYALKKDDISSTTESIDNEDYFENSLEYEDLDYTKSDLLNPSTKEEIYTTVMSILSALNGTTDEDFDSILNNTLSTLVADEILNTSFSSIFDDLNSTFYSIDASTIETLISNSSFSTPTSTIFNITEDPKKAEKLPNCPILHCQPYNSQITTTTEMSLNLSNMEAQQILKTGRTYNYTERKRLRNLCWETMFGQELVKLTVMDLSFTIISIMAMDFIRAVFVRVMNNCWCWDLEKKFPQYGDFKIAENILHLVNNQGMVWMGMFFSPGITVINLIKLTIMMYLRSWAVLTCNVPHEVVFRASRSNNFYLALLLTMLFLCVLPVGFAIVWIEPSWHCGPFSNYDRIYHIFTKSLKEVLPKVLHQTLDYIASPFIVIPLLVLLILIIYYMISLTNALREANNDLKLQLRRERTEERRKMFQIADRRRRNGSGDSGEMDSTPFGKWKKLLPMLPNSKSFDGDTSGTGKENDGMEDKQEENKSKDFLAKFIKRAIKKVPVASTITADDATDTEQHDSLPDDVNNSNIAVKVENENRVMNNFKRLLNAKAKQRKATTQAQPVQRNKGSVTQNVTDVAVNNPIKIEKNRSASRSSSSKDLRQDSLTSNWSENIPVIKISGTGSSECILENQESPPQNSTKPRKIIQHQTHVDLDTKSDDVPEFDDIQLNQTGPVVSTTIPPSVDQKHSPESIEREETENLITNNANTELQIAEPQCASSSSETLTTVKVEELESLVSEAEAKNRENTENDLKKNSNNSDSTISTMTSSRTRTESSTDYME